MKRTPDIPFAPVQAEEALLGAILIDPGVLGRVKGVLAPENFYLGRAEKVYSAMLGLNGGGVDYITVAEELQRRGQLEEIGGMSYIVGLGNAAYTSVHGESYAEDIRAAAMLRQMDRFVKEAAKRLYGGGTLSDMQEWLRGKMWEFVRGGGGGGLLLGENVGAYVEEMVAAVRARRAAGRVQVWPWPWKSWASIINPMDGGMIGVLGGEQGSGKTTYLTHIAEHWAAYGPGETLYVHLEDDTEKQMRRRLVRHCQIPYRNILEGNVTQEEVERIMAFEQSATWSRRLHFKHMPGATVSDIIRVASDLQSRGRCGALIIDYLNLIQATDQQVKMFQNQYDRLAHMIDLLKAFAEGTGVDIPVMIGAQFTKLGKEGRPGVNSLRGSGEIGDKAKLLLFPWRKRVGEGGQWGVDKLGRRVCVAKEGDYSPEVTMIVAKQNEGGGGDIKQWFDGKTFTVRDV